MAKRVDYERRFEQALRCIVGYQTPSQILRGCEREYGLQYHEALEMAYDNIQGEARAALKGYRRKKLKPEPASLASER